MKTKYAARQHAVAAQHTGLNVHRHVTFTDISKGGMREKAVIHQDPKSLPDNANVSNCLMSHVTVGEECKAEECAEWLNKSKEHIIVLTLTKPAVKAGCDMLRFLQQTVAASAQQALSQQGACPVTTFHCQSMGAIF